MDFGAKGLYLLNALGASMLRRFFYRVKLFDDSLLEIQSFFLVFMEQAGMFSSQQFSKVKGQ